jgi:hypothetical protein
MSQRYKGGIISATPPTTSTTSASGIWTEQSVFQAVGAGTWPGAPGAPTIGTATNLGTGGAVSVTFTAPASAGGSPITSFTVTSSPGSVTASGASSPITVSGLTNGTAYTFTATATNAQGTGPASAASNSVTPTLIAYVEDVFSTYLYTGTGASQTITNNIDLATNGGLTWFKNRNNIQSHYLIDSARGISKVLSSNAAFGQGTDATIVTSYNSNGFTVQAGDVNASTYTYASWTFRKQPKFFDIQTWTGDGAVGRTLSHSLGSVPRFIIIKRTDATVNSAVTADRGVAGEEYYLNLNTTAAGTQSVSGPAANGYALINGGSDATNFNVYSGSSGNSAVNASGGTYVAYLFASNAGGFGLTGTDNVITCGSFTTNGSALGQTVNLGYEPQFVITKEVSGVRDWQINDTMRGLPVGGQGAYLEPNTSDAEAVGNPTLTLTSTGFFQTGNGANANYIYLAIRRGPMKVPTDVSKVFAMATAVGTNPAFVSNAVVDMGFNFDKTAAGLFVNQSRLSGANYLNTRGTSGETAEASRTWDYMNGMIDSQSPNTNNVGYMLGRAPGFFDEVCYTGDGANTALVYHNLQASPELVIIKRRDTTSNWMVTTLTGGSIVYSMGLNSTSADNASLYQGTAYSAPTYIGVRTGTTLANITGATYVAYLFATLAGISKVGTYTGNGATQTINCGFTGGARWVLIKRADATGDWYVYDTLRGMTVLTDPYTLMNSAAAEVATLGSVTTVATGFALNSAILAAINVSAGTYIFLAIA